MQPRVYWSGAPNKQLPKGGSNTAIGGRARRRREPSHSGAGAETIRSFRTLRFDRDGESAQTGSRPRVRVELAKPEKRAPITRRDRSSAKGLAADAETDRRRRSNDRCARLQDLPHQRFSPGERGGRAPTDRSFARRGLDAAGRNRSMSAWPAGRREGRLRILAHWSIAQNLTRSGTTTPRTSNYQLPPNIESMRS